MNKKFSTLLTVGLLTGGTLFSYVDAKEISAETFVGAIGENGVLNVSELDLDTDGVIELAGEVNLYDDGTSQANTEAKKKLSYVIIKDDGVTLTSFGKEAKVFKGRIVIAAEGVTVNNLKLQNNIAKAVTGGFWNNTS